jgi:hypothetical protein
MLNTNRKTRKEKQAGRPHVDEMNIQA